MISIMTREKELAFISALMDSVKRNYSQEMISGIATNVKSKEIFTKL